MKKKPKVTLFKFNAEEIKQADVTRFINLLKKLEVKVEVLETPKKLKGQKYDMVVIDEVANVSQVKELIKKRK